MSGTIAVIETERLVLREYRTEDFEALCPILSDAETMRHYPHSFGEAEIRAWIARNQKRYSIFGFGLWAVLLKETGELIGDCGLTMQNIGREIKPEIGYHIRRDLWRQGYAKEAAGACLRWTFEHTPFQTVYSYMKYTNVASYSTACSIGMHQVDEFADPVNTITKVYGITRAEWNENRAKEQ